MSRTRLVAPCLALMASTFAALAAGRADAAATSYTITEIGPPPGAKYYRPTDINNKGQVAGVAPFPNSDANAAQPYLYSNGAMTAVGSPVYSLTTIGINNNGQTWDTGNVPFPADKGINDAGQHINGNTLFSGGQTISLGDFSANAINNHGELAGGVFTWDPTTNGHVAIYQDGKITDLSASLGLLGTVGAAYGLNDRGDLIYQTSESRSGQHNGIRYADGHAQPLGFSPIALNNLGQVVGEDSLFQDGKTVTLQSLLPPSSQSLWSHLNAMAINDAGQIVGAGSDGVRYAAFLMTPVPTPEPSALALLVVVGAGLAARRAMRRGRA